LLNFISIGALSDGNLWVLGLRDIETKSANNTLKVFKEIFSDLNDISDSENNPVSSDIIKHICATLSDRAPIEMKFNNLLESYRKDVLPLIYLNYDTGRECKLFSFKKSPIKARNGP
jgi:hypothetical protein